MKITTVRDIDAPASTVWKLLGEQFGDVSEWAASIEKSSLDRPLGLGAVRTCDIKAVGPVAAGQVTEELTRFDRESRALTFVVRSGVPKAMRLVENAWTVESLDDGRARAKSVVTIRVAWWMLPLTPMVRFQLRRALRAFTADLSTAVKGATVKASEAVATT